MKVGVDKIAYVVADLKRIGPTNQTLNIITNSGSIKNCLVITLFEECKDTRIDDYKNLGINVICLNLSRKNVLLIGALRLKELLQNEKVKMVHSWGTFADIVSFYAVRKIDIPHVITLRCYPMEDAPTRMNPIVGYVLAMFVLHIYKHSNHIIACSKSIKEKMEKAYMWANLSFIQNGVDTRQYTMLDYKDCREKLKINDNEIVFISMGSMIPRKRIDETVDAFLESEIENKRLLILGEGVLLEKYKEKYKNPKVEFLGKIRDVVPYLSASDVFISSSESEGMPNAVLEAIACDKPVILSDIPQHKEVIDTLGGCGIIYHLGNKKELSKEISKMTKNTVNRMKLNCVRIHDSDFVMTNMGRKYEKYYEKIER